MTTFKIVGINSDTDTCECCGKTGLKKVVWLNRMENGATVETVPFGVNCAAMAMKTCGAAKVWTLAQQADADRTKAELTKVHEVGGERSVRPLVVESIGQNGGSITLLGYANGLKSLVEKWAAARWPNEILMVRWAR